MSRQPPHDQVVLRTDNRRACVDSRLVLASAGIASTSMRSEDGWLLTVAAADFLAASEELESYHSEQADDDRSPVVKTMLFGGAPVGVFIYIIVVVSVAALDQVDAYGWQWRAAGRMQAGQVTGGQIWRSVTALTLHQDLQHLVSNLVFGGVFGLMAGRILGGGVAWMTIVAAGSTGNLINAWLRDPDFSSIGASTAVFAALGLMVAHALKPHQSPAERPMKRWRPLIAGVVLLAFIGVGGERTDVLAHAAGFVSGLAFGFLACRLPNSTLANPRVQLTSATATLCLVAVAWCAAIVVSGSA